MTALWQLLSAPRPGWHVLPWVFGATALFVLFFAALHALPGRTKQFLIIAVTFLSGLYYFLEFLLPAGFGMRKAAGGSDNVLSLASAPLSDFQLVVGAMAIGLGVINLLQINGKTILRGRSGWHNSLAFFIGLIGMIVVAYMHGVSPDSAGWNNWYQLLFAGMYQSLAGSTFALLAFFIASAAFRAFRIGSIEATLMMITAFIVMLGNVGSEMLTGWINPNGPFAIFRLDNMTYWIMTTVNMSAQRALLFGIAMGELAIALRIWLSLERGHFFEREV